MASSPPNLPTAVTALPVLRCVFSQEEIQVATGAIADRLWGDLIRKQIPVAIVPLLNGGLYFAVDLIRRLENRQGGLPVHLEPMRVFSYGEAKAPQHRPVCDLFPRSGSVEGKQVVLVDDICDSGATLACARDILLERGPASLHIVTLITRQPKTFNHEPYFTAFNLNEDDFLVGRGMDWKGGWRGLLDIWAIQ